ncbi:MAG: hypothetical protein HY738_18715, partial [Bacteroidia bacterium]|nr:hypothetical protein [Bacteroidia bacterium]
WQCKVRISEYNNPAVSDVSNVNFFIVMPYITVTAPNGGESWKGCSSKSVTWVGAGISGYYTVKYSTNGGTSWTTLISNTTSTSYTWNPVPSINSSDCYIKVYDYNNSAYKDSSNAPFTLVKNTDIGVTAPNGAENWVVGTSQNITWVSEPTSTAFAVYYSVNNGSSWSTINSYTTVKTQAWTIPNNPSSLSLVKVSDYNNSCIYDISDANFTISTPPPYITVTAPNSATTLYVGNSTNITWTSGYLTSTFVTIEYTYNNGSTWDVIANVTENDGTYAWTVPNNISSQCKVRISEYNNPAVYDVSDVNFTIAAPYITVTAPNGGENLEGCSSKSVTWTSAGTSGYYTVKYSINNGASWSTLVSNTSSTTYSWSVPSLSSTSCYVKVHDYYTSSISDSSNSAFTIVPNDDVIITSPDGGESWQVATVHTITWVSDPGSTYFNVYYSTNGGTSWNTLTTNTSAHSYSWTIPNSPGNNYKVKVVDYNSSCKFDVSNGTFTVTPAPPKVNTPNGGETLYYGSSYTITWTNQYYNSSYVTIELSPDSGLTWLPVASVTNNNGSYTWSIPGTYSNKCLIKVSEYNNPSAYDISDAVFTISQGLVILSPNGDGGSEEWRVCTPTSIRWTIGGGSSYYKIEYSLNNGATWSTLSSSYYVTGTTCTYDWTLPSTPSTLCLVRVTDTSYPLKTDVSDNTFTIEPAISVTSPNGGESLTIGSNYTITWTSTGASNYYNIDYSINGGSSWTNIVFNQYIATNSYSWTVPSASSTNCLIKITDNVNTCKSDISNNTFAIGTSYPTITVTSPNGGESFSGCGTTNITWTSASTTDYYTIEYSKDNGVIWNTIISNYNTLSGIYAWTIPNIASSNCKVRVKDYNNPSVYDISDAVFTINQSVTASITAGGPTTFCSGNSVTLTSSSATGNVWSPGGQTTQAITVTSSGIYYTVVTISGCSANSNSIFVTVNSIPSAPVVTSNSPVELYGTINLNASTIPNASYNWTGPNSFTSNIQNPSISNATSANSGTYSVTADVNGCTSSAASTTVTVTSTPATVYVSGAVITEYGSAVGGVTLERTGTGSPASYVTSSDGAYTFSMDMGSQYIITPSKNNDIVTNNGISTLDIILTQRHILNVAPFNSPYQIIAADVNKSNSVTTLDIVLIRSVILQNTTTFPNNQLWSFVNSSYVFPDPFNPFPYESTRSYSSASNLADQNFVGIKLGDVNGSWDNNIAKSGSDQNLTLTIGNTTAVSGQDIFIPVKVEGFNNISGYQFTVIWNPSVMQFINVENVELNGYYNTDRANEGILTTLWSDENLSGVSIEDGSVIFELHFTVNGNHSCSRKCYPDNL